MSQEPEEKKLEDDAEKLIVLLKEAGMPNAEQVVAQLIEKSIASGKTKISAPDLVDIMKTIPKKKTNPLPGFDFNDPKVLEQLAIPGCRKCHGRGFTATILQITGDTTDAEGNRIYHPASPLKKPVPNQCSCVRKTLRRRISFDSNTGKITVHKD